MSRNRWSLLTLCVALFVSQQIVRPHQVLPGFGSSHTLQFETLAEHDALSEIRILEADAQTGIFKELVGGLASEGRQNRITVTVDCYADRLFVIQTKTLISTPVVISKESCLRNVVVSVEFFFRADVRGVFADVRERISSGWLHVSRCSNSRRASATRYPLQIQDTRWTAAVPADCVYLMSAPAGDYSPIGWPQIRLSRGEQKDLGLSALTRAAVLNIRVQLPSGSPGAGVTVGVVRGDNFEDAVRSTLEDSPTDEFVNSGNTDDAGLVTLRGLSFGTFYLLLKRIGDAPNFSHPIELSAAQVLDTTIIYEPRPAAVNIRVLRDLSSSPDAEVSVLFTPRVNDFWMYDATITKELAVGLDEISLSNLPSGSWRVNALVRKGGMELPGAIEQVDLVPGQTASLTLDLLTAPYKGVVKNRGNPLGGALLAFRLSDPGGRVIDTVRAQTGPDGKFDVRLRDSGYYDVTVSTTAGLNSVVKSVRFDTMSQEVEVILPSGRITGTVTAPKGTSVANVLVQVKAFSNDSAGSISLVSATTDATGRFSVDGLTAGRWVLRASNAGLVSSIVIVNLPNNGEAEARLNLQLGAIAAGQFIDEKGEGIPGVTGSLIVLPSGDNPIPSGSGLRGEIDGSFSVPLQDVASNAPLVNIVAYTPGRALQVFQRRASTDIQLQLIADGGPVRLRLPSNTEKRWPLNLLALVNSNREMISVGEALRIKAARVAMENDSASIIIPKLASGLWRVVAMPSLSDIRVGSLVDKLPTLATFVVDSSPSDVTIMGW